jgi:peptidoglycan/xylan/chitin deacetylase (PgdA/CDA1 family)
MRMILFSFLIFLNINLYSQEGINNEIYYAIAPIYNFKHSILSITFDDGVPNQFTVAVPLLNARNIPATFYVPIYSLSDSALRSMVFDAYLAHHEIGSHSVNHYNLANLNRSQVDFELSQSLRVINTLLKSNDCLTLAYPFGTYNDSVIQITKKYYLAARSVLIGFNSIDNIDRYRLKVKYYTHDANLKLLNRFVKNSIEKGLWEIELFHGINGQGYEPINSDLLSSHLDYIKSRESQIWFATVSNVIKYADESKNVKLICDECNDSIYRLRLEDNLNDSIYNQPLSLKIRIPDNWEDDIQLNRAQLIKTFSADGNRFLLFNALPNNQLITIKPVHIDVLKFEPALRFLNLGPNPFIDHIDISFEVINPPFDIYISIINTDGKEIYNEKVNCTTPIINIQINTNNFSSGLYLFKIIVKTPQNKFFDDN